MRSCIILILILALSSCGGLDEEEPTYVDLPSAMDITLLPFEDKLFVLSGHFVAKDYVNIYGGVYSTEDGKNWELINEKPEFSARCLTAAVEYNGKMWIMGGIPLDPNAWPTYNTPSEVWSSSDGKHWELETEVAAFGRRAYHSVVVFNNRMWVLGGADPSTNIAFNTACASTNGKDWECFNSSLSWISLPCFAYNGKLYLNSGNSVFVSENGVVWTKITSDTLVPGRMEHAFFFYSGKFWVLAGIEPYGNFREIYKDVWATTPDNLQNWCRVSTNSLDLPNGNGYAGYVRGENIVLFRDRIWVIKGGFYEYSTEDDEYVSYYVSHDKYSKDGVNWSSP